MGRAGSYRSAPDLPLPSPQAMFVMGVQHVLSLILNAMLVGLLYEKVSEWGDDYAVLHDRRGGGAGAEARWWWVRVWVRVCVCVCACVRVCARVCACACVRVRVGGAGGKRHDFTPPPPLSKFSRASKRAATIMWSEHGVIERIGEEGTSLALRSRVRTIIPILKP